MLRLDKVKQANVISAFNDTSRYLDDIGNIDNIYFAEFIPDIYILQNWNLRKLMI